MTRLIRLLDLLTAGPLLRAAEARILEANAANLDDSDNHAAAVLVGRAAQLRTWRPA
jgi:hypothetical protein